MYQEKITVVSGIAQMMIDLQIKHSLPINIIVGRSKIDFNGTELQELICEYDDEDYHAYAWLVDKAVITYANSVLMQQTENLSSTEIIAMSTIKQILSELFGIIEKKGGQDGKD